MARIVALVALWLLSTSAWADDPVVRLQKARRMQCSFAGGVIPKSNDRQQAVKALPDNGGTTFDNIDTWRKTAQLLAGDHSGELRAIWRGGALWFTERTPEGNLIITTILPQYRQGSRNFVAVESRQSHLGDPLPGESSAGTCRIVANW